MKAATPSLRQTDTPTLPVELLSAAWLLQHENDGLDVIQTELTEAIEHADTIMAAITAGEHDGQSADLFWNASLLTEADDAVKTESLQVTRLAFFLGLSLGCRLFGGAR